MSKNKDDIEYLDRLTDQPLPNSIKLMGSKEVEEVRQYVESVLELERRGLDRLFDSMTYTMKYLPNFLLHALAPKYVDPPIAARISAKLTLKQAVGIASGLSAEYLAESTTHMKPELAAAILNELKPKLWRKVIFQLIEMRSPKLLDMTPNFEPALSEYVVGQSRNFHLDEESLNEKRLRIYRELK